MKALVLADYLDLRYEEIPRPEPGAEDILVRVKACAICGSDVHGLDGSTGRRIPPLVMGHEAAGVIEALGANVTGFAIGDPITFDSTIYCGKCAFCRRGQVNLCDDRRVLGVSCGEYRQHGAMADYVVIPQHIAYRLPAGLSCADAAMVEPVAIARHAVHRSQAALGVAAVVVGVGTIGLCLVQLLRLAGCHPIVAVDLDPTKLDLARRLGATHAFPGGEDLPARVACLTGGRGADAAFEAVGTASTLQAALSCLRKGGALTLVGNLVPQVEFPLQQAVTRELSVSGSCASAGEYDECLGLIAGGRVDVKPLVSAVVPLAEGAAWFDRLYRKEPGLLKVVLVP